MMDQELAKINEEMKIALESSFFEQDDNSKDWKWEIADQKMSSYMDIAQLKVQSKVIFKSIEEIEQEIAKLKNQKSSINNVINEKERTSHKKIKQMEEKSNQTKNLLQLKVLHHPIPCLQYFLIFYIRKLLPK